MSVSTSTILTNVLSELGRNPNNSSMQTRALRWINKSLDKIQGFLPDLDIFQMSEMTITLEDGTATYPMPSDFLSFDQMRIDSENRILNIFNREEFDRRHPYPSDENEDVPEDVTFEYDRQSPRWIMRVGPIPDTSYDAHGIMRRWHPSLTTSQVIQHDKLETAIEDGGIYHGSLTIYQDAEYAQYRQELKQNWLDSINALRQFMNKGKIIPKQIPTMLKRNDYYQWLDR